MAIVSISRLQHRRGLRADLPDNLNEAELGWCLDTRQLFIGNGNTFTGNSQILTQWSPNDQIITHAYQGATGISANSTVTRTLGSILDDYLDVKDYGAVGDGVTDDTVAIQTAISDEWNRVADAPYSALMSRNNIFLPAGNYLISSTIKLYPFTTLVGEGIHRTQITLSAGSSGPVFRTADSQGQTASNIGTNGAVLPTSINVKSMTIDSSADSNSVSVLLQRCLGFGLSSCTIIGSWEEGTDPNLSSGAILVESLGNLIVTSDIVLNSVNVTNATYALQVSDPITRIDVNSCQIYQTYRGFEFLGGASGPSYVQISNSSFRDIASNALLVTTTNRGVSSVNNSYTDVGIAETEPVIYWGTNTNACTSIGDVFSQADRSKRIINLNPGSNLVFNAQQSELIVNRPTPLSVTLLDNQLDAATGISYSMQGITTFSGCISYSITMDTYRRTGQLQITSDGSTASVLDTNVELNMDVSVSFSAAIVGNNLVINYTSTGSNPGLMKYIVTYWKF